LIELPYNKSNQINSFKSTESSRSAILADIPLEPSLVKRSTVYFESIKKSITSFHSKGINLSSSCFCKIFSCIFCLLSFQFWSESAFALDQQDQILGRQAQEEKKLEDQFRDLRAPSAKEEIEALPSDLSTEEQFLFEQIQVAGVTHFSKRQMDRITKPFLKKKISVADLDTLLKNLTDFYIDRGYVTARVYLKSPNLKTSVLIIQVIEGTLDDIEVERNGVRDERSLLGYSDSGKSALNLRDLEQTIDQITRLQTYDAQLELKPGEEEGGSIAYFKTAQSKKVAGHVSYDNSGSKATGRDQGEIQLILEDYFGIYDAFMITGRRDLDFDDHHHRSQSLSFNAGIPVGYWTMRYSASYFEYRSTVKGNIASFRSSGFTATQKAELERVLHRNQVSKTGVSFFASHRNAKNALDDHVLDQSTNKMTPVGVRLFHNHRVGPGSFSGALTYSQGTRLWGAPTRVKENKQAPNPQFKKLTLDASYSWQFLNSFYGSIVAFGQHTPDRLFSSERVSIGGSSTVRGFQETSINGDQGYYVRNELGWRFYDPQGAKLKKYLGSFQTFVGFDHGGLIKDKRDPQERGQVSSVSLGLRNQGGHVSTEITLSRSIDRPYYLKDEGLVAYGQVTVHF
jgi:hemolysin activation/secretion protein